MDKVDVDVDVNKNAYMEISCHTSAVAVHLDMGLGINTNKDVDVSLSQGSLVIDAQVHMPPGDGEPIMLVPGLVLWKRRSARKRERYIAMMEMSLEEQQEL